MEEYVVNSFAELHEILGRYRKSNSWAFRGQKDLNWCLIPKAGREPYSKANDLDILSSWKRRAFEMANLGLIDEWDWLAVAQHHRLATRLLDWTFNPLVAAFFAVEDVGDHDRAIYAHGTSKKLLTEKLAPADCRKGIFRVRARSVASRLSRQQGCFTVHCPPTLSLEEGLGKGDQLERIVIKSTYREKLLFELSHYGISRLNLFPDLDGLSDFINWMTENRGYWSALSDLDA